MELLLIEDDLDLAKTLKQALASSHKVDYASTGNSGLSKVENHSYTVIILDTNLRDMSGLEACKQLRSMTNAKSILVLSGNGQALSKIQLLDAGADDYLTKPFSLGELKARLRVLARRTNTSLAKPNLVVGDLILDRENFEVRRNERLIKLRRKEFALLECLMQRSPAAVTREALSRHAWRRGSDPWTNTIDVHIKYLRDRVDRPFDLQLIKTVHGIGYKIETAPVNLYGKIDVK